MKTTVELSDELLLQAKRRAVEERTTLRELLETGLRLVLLQKQPSAKKPYVFPVIRNALKARRAKIEDANQLIDAIRAERLP
jgi:hypothetical protein